MFLGGILVVSLFCLKALFPSGLFTAHDIWHQVARLYWYNESVLQGVFPPHWIAPMANGFGYPLFVFSYHFPWMVGLPFLFLGVSIESTIKILFFISFLFSGWGMYWCSYLFTKSRFASVTSAILYVVAPWRFVTIFVSAAMGRAFVFMVLPVIVVSLYYLSKNKKVLLPLVLFSLTMSALILSHLISIITSVVVVIPFAWYLKTSLKKLIVSGGITVGLTWWYLYPVFVLSKSIQASTGQFKTLYLSQFVNFKQLLYSPWGYGIVEQSAKEGPFSYQLGIAQWIVMIASFLFIIKIFRLKAKDRNLILFLFLAFVLSIFLMLDGSIPIWKLASRFASFDYPTMFLMPALFISSFLAAVLLVECKKARFVVGFFLVLVAFINNRNYMRVNQYLHPNVEDVVAAEITTNTFNEYLPLTADTQGMIKNTTPDIDGEGLLQLHVARTSTQLVASFEKRVTGEVTLKVFGFSGLKVLLDGTIYHYKINNAGLVTVVVEPGYHKIIVFYEQ